jgi:hypothetical protein
MANTTTPSSANQVAAGTKTAWSSDLGGGRPKPLGKRHTTKGRHAAKKKK